MVSAGAHEKIPDVPNAPQVLAEKARDRCTSERPRRDEIQDAENFPDLDSFADLAAMAAQRRGVSVEVREVRVALGESVFEGVPPVRLHVLRLDS